MSHNKEYIKCECGDYCPISERFSIYDVDFCSMSCLQKFRKKYEKDEKPSNSKRLVKIEGGALAY